MAEQGSDRQRLVDAFVLKLADDPAVEDVHLPVFRAQIGAILGGITAELVHLSKSDIDRYVDSRGGLGETPQSLRNLRTAGHAFVDFLHAPDRAQWVVRAREQHARDEAGRRLELAERRAGAERPPEPTPVAKASLREEDRQNDGSFTDARDWVARPWNRVGLLMAFGVASPLLLRLVPVVDGAATPLRWSALAAAFYSMVNHVSRGREGMPDPGVDSDPLGIGLPQLFRALGTALILVGPAVFLTMHAVYTDQWSVEVVIRSAALLSIAAALGPAAVVAGEVTGSGFTAMYPPAWFRLIWRMPRDYAAVARWCMPLAGLIIAWELFTSQPGANLLIELPFAVLGNLLWFSIATLCGRLIYLHEDDFGLVSSKRNHYDHSLQRSR
jgi:hypothetical protein